MNLVTNEEPDFIDEKKIVIIGNGMVANACRALSGWENDILYASGVSNSAEHRAELFEKEIDLINYYLTQLSPKGSFVYFSTTSIMDPSKSGSPYIKHKLIIESMLREKGINHLIVRLPNLVGKSRNPHTLTNFFADSIKKGKQIRLIRNAVRHLIDADDLAGILEDIRQKYGKKHTTVDVETNRPLTAHQILTLMEDAMKAKCNVAEGEGIISEKVKDVFSSAKYIFETPENYHRTLINKYYGG
jgi:nucleoside-diphosphate-sugar epimerase